MDVVALETPSLGDRSYLVHDGEVAVVIDPQRDIDRVLEAADKAGVRITHVAETHIHNDYVTGGFALARETGAAYLVGADDEVDFDREPVRDGDVINVSPQLSLRAMATPGHTFTHLSYVASRGQAVGGVFTGGSLLFRSTGRPDLLGPEHTPRLVREQHASAQRLATELADDTPLYPTHGFGSFCSSGQSDVDSSTIGEERKANPALTLDIDTFAKELLAGLDAYPSYYAQMAPLNRRGPAAADLEPPWVAADDIRRLDGRHWVVDVRDRRSYAAEHAAGTVNIELDGSLATYLGWLMPWGTPVGLVADKPATVGRAHREVVRIGVEPVAAAAGDPADWSDHTGSYRRATFADLEREQRTPHVLDVRRDDERRESHLPGSQHIPIHELRDRVEEVPNDREVWVHCATGMRAATAASMLAAAGRVVVLVDDDYPAGR